MVRSPTDAGERGIEQSSERSVAVQCSHDVEGSRLSQSELSRSLAMRIAEVRVHRHGQRTIVVAAAHDPLVARDAVGVPAFVRFDEDPPSCPGPPSIEYSSLFGVGNRQGRRGHCRGSGVRIAP